MSIHSIPIEVLFESYIFSDKTVSCDLSKWGRDKNTLFIVGLPGSGKSTLGQAMAKKYNAEYYGLDKLWIDVIKKDHPDFDPWKDKKDPMDPRTFDRKSIVVIKDKMKSSPKLILEGVQIVEYWLQEPSFRKMISPYPCIILGESILKSGWRSIKRQMNNKPPPGEDDSWWQHFKWMRNYKYFNRELNYFREERLAVPGTEVKEFKV